MRQPITITLADQEYKVRPLTLGTIRELDLLASGDIPEGRREREAFLFDQYVGAISAALREEIPDMTAEKVLSMRTTMAEIVIAYRDIMVLSGLIQNPQMDQPNPAQAVTTGPTPTAG